jgi:hypothetical protein
VAVLVAAGIEAVPTFRTPHVTPAFKGDLDEGLARLERAVVMASMFVVVFALAIVSYERRTRARCDHTISAD